MREPPGCQTESAAPLRAEFLMRLVSDYAEPDAVFAGLVRNVRNIRENAFFREFRDVV